MKDRGNNSAYISRIKALRNKHALLSERIEKEQSRPSTTDFYLRQLKKQKLLLKDKLEGVLQASNSDEAASA